jgi:hypothetical protein
LRVYIVTLEEVMNLAEGMGIDERWQIWQFCGTHDLATLPTTATREAPPPRYCPECMTAWTTSGGVLNEPRRPAGAST